jgi:hypothetical protein
VDWKRSGKFSYREIPGTLRDEGCKFPHARRWSCWQ